MNTVKIDLCGLPDELRSGLEKLCMHEGFRSGTDGIRLSARRGGAFSAEFDGQTLRVEYCEPVQFFRALSYLKRADHRRFALHRQPVFEHNGVMLDCSRNAVPRVEAVKMVLRKMALMGLNTLMLYTEDTYEVPEQPYFGYLRGRYSVEALRGLDSYAAALGIELVPCIQTLAHLERALHWPQVDAALRDTEDILMVGEEKTYVFIEQLLRAVSGTFRTRRVHIGMDEAWSLGLGNYRFKNGFVPSHQLMEQHLARVCAIAQKYSLQPMIWSDMYLRAASPTGGYYDAPGQLPADVLSAARRDVPLVYWDYYHNEQPVYEHLLHVHAQFGAPVVFAGGLWTWVGPAPAVDKMRASSLPGLHACETNGIRSVFATAWGDNGGEANLLTALYGMQLYAEYDYTGDTRPDVVDERFRACTGEDPAAFAYMGDFNTPPGVAAKSEDPVNAAKFLLYEDPLVPLFAADTAGMSFSGFYADLARKYENFSSDSPEFEALYRFYEQLARLLERKCRWREQAPRAKAGTASVLAQLAGACARQTLCCKRAWETLWDCTNNPFGFEVIDLRLSGLAGRFDTAARRMERFAAGDASALETLFSPKLRYLTDSAGHFSGCYSWTECISACRI